MYTLNKKSGISLAAVFLAVFLFSGCSSNQTSSPVQNQKSDNVSVVAADSSATQPNQVATEKVAKDLYKVVKVVDGDTIDVDLNGKIERLRLIGMDTPETVDPRKVVQCFGKDASNKAKEILDGKMVSLEADSTQGERDKYDRLLRYVFLEDGTFYNKKMISDGYAHEYTYDSNPYKYQSDFIAAEKQAREAGRGLWSSETCNGDTTKAADAPKAVEVPTTTVKSTPTTITPVPTTTTQSGGVVKKSKTGICHAPGTTYYNRTTNYTSFNSLDACLSSGGRLPLR